MPTSKELLNLFKCYLVVNAGKNLVELQSKLDAVYKNTDISLMRKFDILLSIAIEHNFDEKKIDNFYKNTLDASKYTKNKKWRDKVFEAMSFSEDLFITTNFSNTFKIYGWKYSYEKNNPKMESYVPIHGNVFENKKENKFLDIVNFESHYLKEEYEDRIHLLEHLFKNTGIKKIHIYGYSMNDLDISKQIIRSNKDIYFYLGYEDIQSRDAQISYFENLSKTLKKKIHLIIPEKNQKKLIQTNQEYKSKIKDPYVELLKKFLKNITKSQS